MIGHYDAVRVIIRALLHKEDRPSDVLLEILNMAMTRLAEEREVVCEEGPIWAPDGMDRRLSEIEDKTYALLDCIEKLKQPYVNRDF
tara:strand:+ start:1054 stop:1314 length:261 start_codon:yes stop_codon:yes gene_type:complete